jgi:G:T/U-mismatch repair DNA glycosylase
MMITQPIQSKTRMSQEIILPSAAQALLMAKEVSTQRLREAHRKSVEKCKLQITRDIDNGMTHTIYQGLMSEDFEKQLTGSGYRVRTANDSSVGDDKWYISWDPNECF